MSFTGPIISIVFIVIVARLLLKKVYPHAVLLIAGLLMILVAHVFDLGTPDLKKSTGTFGLDLFKYITESFQGTNAGVGLMIMAIGGFVGYIDHIGASSTLVDLAMKPLGLLKKYPHVAASAVIPIGQLLFIAIPSAAGLGLLLMASIFPILLRLGVSRLSAVSVITACTCMGMGPANAITASASTVIDMPAIGYFVNFQIPLFLPLSILIAVIYFFVNRHFDGKMEVAAGEESKPVEPENKSQHESAPKIYAIIPVLPIIMLIFFSDLNSFLSTPLILDTTTAMFISLFVAFIFEIIRHKKVLIVFESLKVFWNGMGNIFKTVVTLIITADIFSKGLISLGFIEGLLYGSQNLGFSAIGIAIVMTAMIFLSSMLMGSGNAAFFAFGPLIPGIASKFGIQSSTMILPMNFAASMGRTVSPVAGVIIATAEIAGVTTMQIVKRNLIPLVSAFVFMLLYHFLI